MAPAQVWPGAATFLLNMSALTPITLLNPKPTGMTGL
jgi:tRNA A37 threonylcarbamoyladenosine synthetase subunit TsaC/SUA5/YrdC